MAESQIVPITQLHSVGMIKDTPSITLPPQAFSDALNVRFRDGCINKISGEVNLLPTLTGDPITGTYLHVSWWSSPNVTPTDGYFVIVSTDNTYDYLYLVRASDGNTRDLGVQVPSGGQWQSTVYQGGYSVIINNGIARPFYVLDTVGNTDMTTLTAYELPGWDSYYTNEVSLDDVYDVSLHIPEFDLGRTVDFNLEEVVATCYDAETGDVKFSVTVGSVTTVDQVTISYDEVTDSHIATLATSTFPEFLEDGDNVYIVIRSKATVQVRAGVVRAWGDVLVAGNLRELNAPTVSSVDSGLNRITFSAAHGMAIGDKIYITKPASAKGVYTVTGVPSTTVLEFASIPAGTYTDTRYTIVSSGTAVRNQPGVVRISDVAAPGTIPHNWNPYSEGVSTADEFVLATTGIVQDLVEMQGDLFVYTNSSIHRLVKTNNTSIPYVASVVTDNHGALGLDCIKEYNGVHVVVGSNDVYTFSGHPSSIKSMAYGRVRNYLFKNINPSYTDKVFILRNYANDELWFAYPTLASSGACDEVLIWNYVNNTWSRRKMTSFLSGVMAPTRDYTGGSLTADVDASILRPVLCNGTTVFGADFEEKFTNATGSNYESYIERIEAPMSPEFDVESLHSVVLWANKEASASNFDLRLRFRGTDNPSQTFTYPLTANGGNASTNVQFTVGSEYKADVRVNGRFVSYRITDEGLVSDLWRISGIQLDVKKGGRR